MKAWKIIVPGLVGLGLAGAYLARDTGAGDQAASGPRVFGPASAPEIKREVMIGKGTIYNTDEVSLREHIFHPGVQDPNVPRRLTVGTRRGETSSGAPRDFTQRSSPSGAVRRIVPGN